MVAPEERPKLSRKAAKMGRVCSRGFNPLSSRLHREKDIMAIKESMAISLLYCGNPPTDHPKRKPQAKARTIMYRLLARKSLMLIPSVILLELMVLSLRYPGMGRRKEY